jgi:hypothetical protein
MIDASDKTPCKTLDNQLNRSERTSTASVPRFYELPHRYRDAYPFQSLRGNQRNKKKWRPQRPHRQG